MRSDFRVSLYNPSVDIPHTQLKTHTRAQQQSLNSASISLFPHGDLLAILTLRVAKLFDTFSDICIWGSENFPRKLWVHAKWLTFRRSFRYRFKLDQRCWTTNAFLSTSTWFRYFRYSARLQIHRRGEHTDTHFGSSTPRERGPS